MRLFIAVGLATFYGLIVRAIFGFFEDYMAIMTVTFFFVVPWLVGFITINVLPYKETNTTYRAFFIPMLPLTIIFIVIWIFNAEGMICLVLAFPLCVLMSGLGGIVAHNRKKRKFDEKKIWDFEKEDWGTPGSLKISFLVLLPVFAVILEGDRTSSVKELTIEKRIEIQASPGKIWNIITSKEIKSVYSSGASFSKLLGFPHHVSTSVILPALGGTRVATYQKGLVFEETIIKFEKEHLLGLEIKTDPSKISKAIMDEHIVIGGKHVKLLEDNYTLSSLANGNTLLTLSCRMNINTPFNWYAGIWSKLFMSEILNGELNTIKTISEK